jgi:hypothetical protein
MSGRRWQLLRYRAMERQSTDPLAVGLLHDIVLELQADLLAVSADEPGRAHATRCDNIDGPNGSCSTETISFISIGVRVLDSRDGFD